MEEHPVTQAPIDQLTNRELDEAVAIRLGWKWYLDTSKTGHHHGMSKNSILLATGSEPLADNYLSDVPEYHDNISLALSLLAELEDDIDISYRGDQVSVFRLVYMKGSWTHRFELLASGPKSELARLCCVAFLKLNGESL